jgi:hypothetical protein
MGLKVLVLEENLLWSVRLKKSLESLGHEVVVVARPQPTYESADIAIINLGSPAWELSKLVPQLQAQGTKIIAHAGHKEKELHDLGKQLGSDVLATNSELTHKLPQILEKLGL